MTEGIRTVGNPATTPSSRPERPNRSTTCASSQPRAPMTGSRAGNARIAARCPHKLNNNR